MTSLTHTNNFDMRPLISYSDQDALSLTKKRTYYCHLVDKLRNDNTVSKFPQKHHVFLQFLVTYHLTFD